VGAKIDINLIPIPPGFDHWLTKEQILNWILYGGEDFELVLTLPETNAKNIINQIGNNAAIIGYITAETEIILTDNTGKYSSQILKQNQTFQHFN
ncbi:MAG TPA: thiamine-phosphate kinase, partial [Allocoleopsis sp.]